MRSAMQPNRRSDSARGIVTAACELANSSNRPVMWWSAAENSAGVKNSEFAINSSGDSGWRQSLNCGSMSGRGASGVIVLVKPTKNFVSGGAESVSPAGIDIGLEGRRRWEY